MVGWLQEIQADSLQAVLTKRQSYGMCKLVSSCSHSILIPLQGLLTFPSAISLQLSQLTHSWNWLQQSMSNALLKIPQTVSNLFLYLSLANLLTAKANANVPLFYSETGESLLVIKGPQGRINRAIWGPLNRTIISAGEDSVVRIWDSEVFLLISYIYLFCKHLKSLILSPPITMTSFLFHLLACRLENYLRSQTRNLATKRQ